jgi:hypothetical protein
MGVNGRVYGCPRWHSVDRPEFRNARFVQVGTYKGFAFVSASDDGRWFGSVFQRSHSPEHGGTLRNCCANGNRTGVLSDALGW